ncbi:IS1595-like element ISSod11 family transposase [Terrabacter koreensis]
MTANPVRGVDYSSTYQQLLEWFPDNQSCLDYLAGLRWPDGFVCPKCGAREYWRTGAGLWMCRACGRRTSVTAGTIFDRTRTPLSTWFAAIWFLTSQKNGMSALGLQRVLGFGSYETAWAWMHKLRRAMVRPERDKLSGIVELDETMIGGVARGRAGYGDKVAVMIAIEHNETRRLGRVRLAVADHPGTTQLVDFATTVIEPGSTIRTDGARTLRRLADLGYRHEFTLGYTAIDKASVLPGVHLVASLLKRWLIGTLHFRVEEAHLPYYLDEYTFRFNRRNAKSRGLLFYRLLEQAVDTSPHPLKDLLKPETGMPDFT